MKTSRRPAGGESRAAGASDHLFDCGTTTPWIIEAIDNELPFTAICYSLNTFLVLQEKPQCRVILCGGEFHASNAIFKPLDFRKR